MPQIVTDWAAKERRIEAALLKVRAKQDALRAEEDRLRRELAAVEEARLDAGLEPR